MSPRTLRVIARGIENAEHAGAAAVFAQYLNPRLVAGMIAVAIVIVVFILRLVLEREGIES